MARYADSIDAWELFNEPSNADKYAELCRETAPIFKKAHPQGILSGLSSAAGKPVSNRFKALGGHQYLDAISTHIYLWQPEGKLAKAFLRVFDDFQKEGRPMPQWMTEGSFGAWGGTFFRSHPAYRPERNDVRNIPRYLTVAKSSGVKRVFFYWSNYPAPREQSPVIGSDLGFYHHDTSLTAGAAAWSVWACMLDGAEPLGSVVEKGREVHYFKDGADIVAVLWSEEPGSVVIGKNIADGKKTCSKFDVMGNEKRIDLSTPAVYALSQFVTYLRFKTMSLAKAQSFLNLPD